MFLHNSVNIVGCRYFSYNIKYFFFIKTVVSLAKRYGAVGPIPTAILFRRVCVCDFIYSISCTNTQTGCFSWTR